MKEKQDILRQIRVQMKKEGLDALIIPSMDPHQSEYVANHWATRAWLSGFTGSAGTAVITLKHAGLWTDSRYFIQAEKELKDSPFELHKLNIAHTAEHLSWLVQNLKKATVIGLDGNLLSVNQIVAIEQKVKSKSISINTKVDLLYRFWTDRPALPQSPIFELKQKYAGQSRSDNRTKRRQCTDHSQSR